MRSHTTVAGWVMGLLDHFGITRTTAPARCGPPRILECPSTSSLCYYQKYWEPNSLGSSTYDNKRKASVKLPVIPRYSNGCG